MGLDAIHDLFIWPDSRVVHQLKIVEVCKVMVMPVCEFGLQELWIGG
jgi:hypothetical protein